MTRTQRAVQPRIRSFHGASTARARAGSPTPGSSSALDNDDDHMYNVSDHDDFRSTLLFFSRMVGEASPEVRAAAIRLAISTLVPIVGGDGS